MVEVDQPIVYWILSEAVPFRDSLDNLDFLSASERGRFDSMRFEKRRREWLHGRRAAKQLLSQAFAKFKSLDPSDLSIENEPEGSPYIVQAGKRLDLSLSISHRDQYAFCGLLLGRRGSIGVDIEKVEPRSPAFVEDFFTASEVELARSIPAGTGDQTVTLIWSAKEAVLKALGKGLRLDTREVEISSFEPGSVGWSTFLTHSHLVETHHLYGRWQIMGDYTLTLAVLAGEDHPSRFNNIRFVQVNQGSP